MLALDSDRRFDTIASVRKHNRELIRVGPALIRLSKHDDERH